MAERERRPRIDQPREGGRRFTVPSVFTEEAFGVVSEKFARYMGTPYFLIGMTLFVLIWVGWNVLAPPSQRFDKYPFIFLTLMLSLQASYAAPLILLAETRQADRDRAEATEDRRRGAEVKADLDYLARELASLRMRVVDSDDLARLEAKLDRLLAIKEASDGREDGAPA